MPSVILFVEDDAALRDSAALMMTLEGYAVQVASDGLEALALLQEGGARPDLIVSDIAMPRMNGLEFFKRVREFPHLRDIPFIFLTAHGSRQDVLEGQRLGADDYLVKPFDPERFLAAIQNKLQRVRDIRESAEMRLNDARRSLVQLLAHELRTPLTYVSGGYALMAEELEGVDTAVPVDALRDNLALIESGTERLNRLADQMVTFTELQSGHAAAQLKSAGEIVELGNLAASAVCALESDDVGQRVEFKVNLPEGEPPRVHGVGDLLVVALSEVLRNAVHFSRRGSCVTVTVRRERDAGVIEVRDQGMGIKEEDLPHVWDPMVQSERALHEQQGLGLGLTITRGVIELHGGSCQIVSTVGKGTTVTLRLPLAQGSP